MKPAPSPTTVDHPRGTKPTLIVHCACGWGAWMRSDTVLECQEFLERCVGEHVRALHPEQIPAGVS